MRTATRVAEAISALILFMLGAFNPHGEAMIYLIAGLECVAAIFVATTFPRRGSPFVALALVVAVLVTMTSGPFAGNDGGAGLHSPIMGIGALIPLGLLISQITAGIGALGAVVSSRHAT